MAAGRRAAAAGAPAPHRLPPFAKPAAGQLDRGEQPGADLPRHDRAFRQRVPVHLRVGDRGASRQDRRPDLRRCPRRRDEGRPVRPRRLRDAREHGPDRRLGRDLDRDLRRHPGHRARDGAQDRLHRRRPRLLGRLVRRAERDRQAVAGHRPGGRPGLRGAHGRQRRGRARRRGGRRPGDDVRLRLQRDRRADAAADLARAPARGAPRRGSQGGNTQLPAPRRQDPGERPLSERQACRDRKAADLHPAQRGGGEADPGRPLGARRGAGPTQGPLRRGEAAQELPRQPDRPLRDRRPRRRLPG